MACALDAFLLSLRGTASDDEEEVTTLVFVDDNIKPTGATNTTDKQTHGQERQRKRSMSMPHPSKRSSPSNWKGNNGRNRWEEIAAIEKNNFRRSLRHQSMSLPTRSTDAFNESSLTDQAQIHCMFEDSKRMPNPKQLLSKELPPSLRGMPY